MMKCQRENSDRFLAGQLDPREESRFTEHLNSCDRCRHWLEESAGSVADWQVTRELLTLSNHGPGLKSSSIAQSIQDDEALDFESVSISSLAKLLSLAPTDDPSMVGRVGPYEVSAFLGRGAMGIVVKGFDRALNRNVAIKLLDPSIAGHGAARQRFAREARAMAAVSHEHVVPVYGVDQHAGLPYFVMEYVAGGTLERRIASNGACDTVSIVRIALQTAQALSAAHAQGLVHRDIKPGNILMDKGVERIRVADFGLARVSNDVSCTRSGVLAGTPQYMAPEQVRGETCDAQSDLFSLGAVMYILATGHPPFRSESVYGVMQRIVHDTPRPICEQNPSIPIWLEQFIFRLLAKQKQERFGSANEVVTLLQNELAHLQSPATIAEPVRTWVPLSTRKNRQNRVRSILAVAILALIATGLSYRGWLVSANVSVTESSMPLPIEARENGNGSDDSTERQFIQLWNSDNITETQEFARSIEHEFLAPSADSSPDLWSSQVFEIGLQIQRLKRELIPENLEHVPPESEPQSPNDEPKPQVSKD